MGLGGEPLEACAAGTGPTRIGMRTDAGMAGNGVVDAAPELGGGAALVPGWLG